MRNFLPAYAPVSLYGKNDLERIDNLEHPRQGKLALSEETGSFSYSLDTPSQRCGWGGSG